MSAYFSYLLFNHKAVSGLATFLTLQATCCNFHNGRESQALRRAVWANNGRGNIREASRVGDDSGFSGIPLLHYKPDPGWECSRIPKQAGGAGPGSPRWLIACRRSGCGLSGSSPAGNISTGAALHSRRATCGPRVTHRYFVAECLASLHCLYVGQLFCAIGILYQYEICLLRNIWLNWRDLTWAIQKVYHIHEGSCSKHHPAGQKN